MRLIAILLVTIRLVESGYCQRKIDFGIEVQMNQNLVKKWELGDIYDNDNRVLSVLDVAGDTVDLFFNKFAMENNFEFPVYFRYSWKNRQFIDMKLSNSFNTLTMDGISNYNTSFYKLNYGTFEDFEAQAIADGLGGVDTSDYNNYLTASRKDFESKIRSTEKFQLLSMTMNYGYRFFPHKSVKMFLSAGYTIKGKYRKVNYNYLDFSNDFIQDLSSVDHAVSKFAETSLYFNAILGFELYRFRLSLFYQTGIGYTFPITEVDPKIVYVSEFTPFDQLHSYGFSLGVDLFTKKFGKEIKLDEVSEDDGTISKIKRKIDKWDFGIRFNRRGFNDLSTFYANPSDRLSIYQNDSVLISEGGTIKSAEKIEMATFGDIKKIDWTGQIDLVANYYFNKRLFIEGSLGFSRLNFDVATTELTATIVHDTSGNYFSTSSGAPKLRSGVYRKAFILTNLTTSLSYKIIDRDLFDFNVRMGVGITTMGHKDLGFVEFPPGVNELEIYDDFNNAYFGLEDAELKAQQGQVEVDLNNSPDQISASFPEENIYQTWESPKRSRLAYPTMSFGFGASIDRFTLGLTFEKSLNYMDGFMLQNYGSIYFSIGYKLVVR